MGAVDTVAAWYSGYHGYRRCAADSWMHRIHTAYTACAGYIGHTLQHIGGGPLVTRFFFSLRTAPRDANRQPLPNATNHQSPITNRRQPPPTAANRQSPPTMVEHMSYTRFFLQNCRSGKLLFFQDPPAHGCGTLHAH